MAGLENDVLVAKNMNFDQLAPKPHLGVINAAGRLPIGTGNTFPTPEILGGDLVSPDNSIGITYNSPNIELVGNPNITPAAGVQNLGFSYASGTGTFTVHAADGSALSATNPAYVTLQSKSSPSELVKIAVTANQSFVDDAGTSTIIGNLFGLTTGIAYTQDLPFWIYAVSNDAEDEISFMISRYPGAVLSPVSGSIGKTGSAVAATQGSFFALNDPTVADYDENPCVNIGAFRMRMSASDDWTVQTLSNRDGIGRYHLGTQFVMDTGQFGAATGKYFSDNGGTAPAFTTNAYNFYVQDLSGFFNIFCLFGSASTAGVGAVRLALVMPYSCFGGIYGKGFTENAANNPTNDIFPRCTNANYILEFPSPKATTYFTNAAIVLTVGIRLSAMCRMRDT